MLRKLALFAVLAPCLIGAQGSVKTSQGDRTKVLDVAAKTPFFTQKGADAVKKVIAGADARKADEKVLDPADSKPSGQTPIAPTGTPAQLPATQAPSQAPQAPAPEPVFAWRLQGISYGKRHGMALFVQDGKDVSAFNGSTLDPDTKVLSVTRRLVVVEFHGKRLELMPW